MATLDRPAPGASMYDWNDLRCFLAVAREGSTLAAARRLKINQTTVARRIEALEEALGLKLFERKQRGYSLTEGGREILTAAERVEGEAETLERLVAQRSRRMAGVVRVTTNEAFANMVLTPCLGEFAELYPDVRVEVAVSERRLDLARGEADVALRAGAPQDPGLVGRRLGDIRWSIYCSRDYAARRGVPDRPEALKDHFVIGALDTLAELPAARWLAAQAPAAQMLSQSNSLTNLLAALKAGLGVAPLPCMMGDAEPELIRCFAPISELDADLWLITREPLRGLAHVRAFNEFVSARIGSIKHRLAARAAGEA
jgi:DNA-binding transcriptional LysR family regulator